ncbi:hypothetical protein V5740_09555 [Croceibacterium sp. TMG7-5b_MA50]|uniref:hypothetical protein n=1 Tax=Croceibacterium sp. TMG7-5b_MA50 TaxID=3121290 RepID=UPI0032217460
MSAPRTVTATRYDPKPDLIGAMHGKPGQWSGLTRLGVIAGLCVLGWSAILIPIL